MGGMLSLPFYCYSRWLLCVNFRFLVWSGQRRQEDQNREQRSQILSSELLPFFPGAPITQSVKDPGKQTSNARPNTTKRMSGSPCALITARTVLLNVLLILAGSQSLCGKVQTPELDAHSSSCSAITAFIFRGLIFLHLQPGPQPAEPQAKVKQPCGNSSFHFEYPPHN